MKRLLRFLLPALVLLAGLPLCLGTLSQTLGERAAEEVRVLSRPAAPMPVAVSKRRLRLNLDTELSLRPLVLRSLRTRSVFKVQEGISRAFREYLYIGSNLMPDITVVPLTGDT